METENKTSITIETSVNAPVDSVWKYWTEPVHIVKWNNASDDWHTPLAENDLKPGGRFLSRMEAKDGSVGFDFEGIYDVVQLHQYLEYILSDGRKVKVKFDPQDGETKVTETFEPENANPLELQRSGWQAILDSFKTYVETIN